MYQFYSTKLAEDLFGTSMYYNQHNFFVLYFIVSFISHSLHAISLSSTTSTSTSTLLTDKTLQHHISIKFVSINYNFKKYNIIFQGDKI